MPSEVYQTHSLVRTDWMVSRTPSEVYQTHSLVRTDWMVSRTPSGRMRSTRPIKREGEMEEVASVDG